VVSIGAGTKEVLLNIRRLDNELDRLVLTASDYMELVTEAYASNVHWSTRLEGNPLKEEEVVRLTRQTFSGKEGEMNPGPQQEIINHLYTYFLRDRLRPPWSLGTLRSVHSMLTEGTGTEGVPGEFRTTHASIMDQGAEAFIACPPQYLEEETSSLLDWLNSSGPALEPLVCSSVFFHEFESIHPFRDGNGRVGRTLFHLLLQESGMRNSKLCRIDLHLLRDPSVYYDLLAFTDEKGTYSEMIEYFALCVVEAYQEALERFKGKDLLSKGLDEGSIRLVQKAREVGVPFELRTAAGWVKGLGEQSLRARLNRLVEMGFLAKEGRTAATRYRFIDPFQSFKERVREKGYERTKIA
jgi:Fic family protein